MRKVFLVTYADSNYSARQKELSDSALASGAFDDVFMFTEDDLKKSEFYRDNKTLLDERPIGGDGRVKPGYFAWKPWVIREALLKMDTEDTLLYIDCGDELHETGLLKEFLLKKTRTIDVVLTDGAYKNSAYTRGDCFFYMGCTSEHYAHSTQVEAGIFVCKKSVFSMALVNKWMKHCSDRRIVSNDANISGFDNRNNFTEHRWDQSVLSLLRIKMDIYSSDEMRRFVYCNRHDIK